MYTDLKDGQKPKKSLKCPSSSEHGEPVAASPLQALTTRQIFGIFYHLFSAESLWVRACSWSAWEDGLCKIHSIKCSKIVFLDLKCLKCRISFFIKHFTRSVVYNIFVATYLLRPPSKHRQRCLAPAEREVVPPRVRGPLSPLLWVSGWNNPLCNLLCSTVTFRTFVWNRGTWNLPLTTPSSCLPL